MVGDPLRILERSTEALARAVATGDEVALATALDARRGAFERVARQLGEDPPREVQEALARVARLDAEISRQAREVLEAIRQELHELRRMRDSVRSLEAPAPPPRFVSRRA